jgi:hypothetical protein
VFLWKKIILDFKSSGDGTQESPLMAPVIRIPVTSDYWLKGCIPLTSVNSTQQAPYFWQGQCNVFFTAEQYQQAITDMAYYCYSTWKNVYPDIPICFIIDLHWAFTSPLGTTSGSYARGSGGVHASNTGNINIPPWTLAAQQNPQYNANLSTLSSAQLPLPGVCVEDTIGGSSNLALEDQTCAFWTSVASTYGIDKFGNVINTSGSANVYSRIHGPGSLFEKTGSPVSFSQIPDFIGSIFFEVFNEPFTEFLCDPSAPYNRIAPSSNNYKYYIEG